MSCSTHHSQADHHNQGWDKFCRDWPRVVQEAGTSLYPLPLETEGSNQTDITAKHLESVCLRVKNIEQNKILINFELAAMYLSSLMKGKDYPDKVSELAKMHDL